jgi:hypothetical protein
MSYLTLGLSAPTIKQFATEPITIEEPNALRFSDNAGVLKASIGVDGATTIFDIETNTFDVKTSNTTIFSVDGATGEVTAPNGLNGRGLVLGGNMVVPAASSFTLSPAQVQTITAGFKKGLWLVNTFANIQLVTPFPGSIVTLSVSKGATIVGSVTSFVGSDSSESFGNYMHTPAGFVLPMNDVIDTTQSYTFTSSANLKLYQIQFIPLF